MKDYRRLTEDEVLQLKSQSCLADEFGEMYQLQTGFNCEYVHHSPGFSGEVKLGVFDAEFTLPGGIRKHFRIASCNFAQCDSTGITAALQNIQNYIANYEIGNDTFIENVDIILVNRLTTFGNRGRGDSS